MTRIQETTIIRSPIAVCFRLSLNIDLELQACKEFKLQAVGGVVTGTIGPGERVIWRTRQFGIPVTHTSEITACEAPFHFRDSMVQGIFRSFHHDHFFRAIDGETTEMKDDLRFEISLWLLGSISERMFVRRRLLALLRARNRLIQQSAESESYKL